MTELLFSLGYHHWLVAGLMLLILDGFTRGSLPMWLGFAAALEGVALLVLPWFGIHLAWSDQLLVAAPLLALALYAWRRYEHGHPAARTTLPEDLVGGEGLLVTPLRDGAGEVRAQGTVWPATGPDLPALTRVRITAVTAVAFRVEATDNTRP